MDGSSFPYNDRSGTFKPCLYNNTIIKIMCTRPGRLPTSVLQSISLDFRWPHVVSVSRYVSLDKASPSKLSVRGEWVLYIMATVVGDSIFLAARIKNR